MVKIQELLEKRAQYSLANKQGDTWVDDVLAHHCDVKEQWIVVPTGFLTHRLGYFSKQRAELFGGIDHAGAYYLTALFDVGNPYQETWVSFTLVSLSKTKPKAVKIANYKGEARSHKRCTKSDNPCSLHVSNDLTDKYKLQYLVNLQKWSNLGVIPHESEDQEWEFCEVSYDKFDFMHSYPRYYTKSRTALRNLLKETDVEPLSAVADVIVPKGIIENGPVFRVSDAKKYPFNWDMVKSGPCSKTEIQKGDILVPVYGNTGNIYLFDDGCGKKLYAPMHPFVIVRPKTVSPEFLFLYLEGETGQNIPSTLSDLADTGAVLPHISLEELRDFPVLRTKKDSSFYRDSFRLQYLHDATLGEYNVFLGKHWDDKIETVEDVLCKERIMQLHFHKKDAILSILHRDVDEVNICYKGGAYKATLIMAGSILEGLAVDWVSEMFGVDFFSNVDPEICYDIFGKSQPDLKSYIFVISRKCPYLRVPEWMTKASAQEFKTKATEIRLKRNLVHATLCLKDCETIDKNLCDKVIGYLKEIIKIRFGKDV